MRVKNRLFIQLLLLASFQFPKFSTVFIVLHLFYFVILNEDLTMTLFSVVFILRIRITFTLIYRIYLEIEFISLHTLLY